MIALFLASTAFGQANLSTGTRIFAAEDVATSASDEDHNDVVVRYDRQCTVDAAGLLVREQLNFTGVAAGADLTNGLALQLPAPASAVRLCDSAADCDAGGAPLTPDGSHRVTLLDDVLDLFAGTPTGFVNTDGPLVAGRMWRVEVDYAPATRPFVGASACPEPSFAVVRTDTWIDATTTIGANARPLVGTFPGGWSVPTEHTSIATAYPDFLCFVGGGCATWYQNPGAQVVDRTGTLPALDAHESCVDGIQNNHETGIDCGGDVCGSCDLLGDAALPAADCEDVYLNRPGSPTDGPYWVADPCGGATPVQRWCDLARGGWTVAGWQPANATTNLGISARGTRGGANWSENLSCTPYDEVMVFNLTHGEAYTASYPGSTWTFTSTDFSQGANGSQFRQGVYGGSVMMGCVSYGYSSPSPTDWACDNDAHKGQRGHIADYAGEFCPGSRLDGTWAWTNGTTCSYRGGAYSWGIAVR